MNYFSATKETNESVSRVVPGGHCRSMQPCINCLSVDMCVIQLQRLVTE